MTGSAVLLFALTLVAAVANWIAVDSDRRALEALTKPLTMILLIGAALALDPDDGATQAWFVVALVLSLAGDLFLLLEGRARDRRIEPARTLFTVGLGSFLLGHLAYIGGLANEGIVVTRFGAGLALVALAVAVLGIPILRGVRAGPEPGLSRPVAAYMFVISVMVASAVGVGHPAAVVGAWLFYASDSLIAWNRFVRPVPRGRLAIMSTYHLAQIGLVLSLV